MGLGDWLPAPPAPRLRPTPAAPLRGYTSVYRPSLETLVRRAGFEVRSVEPAGAGFKVQAHRP